MRFEAIRKVHPTVVTLRGDSDARDENNNPVVLDEAAIQVEFDRLTQEAADAKAIVDAKAAKKTAIETTVLSRADQLNTLALLVQQLGDSAGLDTPEYTEAKAKFAE